ncbi:MAG: MBL fold metallo-hydrolase [Clostridiales Family XIII bacterium]|jgi:metallo-beta-lactamase family protein|nr:MBL fold metallo-hydrolase [Clostridiales Family XIII bacterium]
MKIKFCGAADGVTGSCHLVTAGTESMPIRILLDCGQFQGGKVVEQKNHEPFPFRPGDIDFVLLSHAHIDHCGRLPLLVKQGYDRQIYCSDATADLLGVMLRDAAHIQEKESEWKSRKAERAGRSPESPLYTMADAEAVLRLVSPVLYDELVQPMEGVRFVLNEAGHILGSAIIELWTEAEGDVSKLVYTGDLGNAGLPLLRDPKIIKRADYVIMESTYGGRFHEAHDDSVRRLADILVKTAERGGTVVIPSFAVGRTQEMIYECNDFYEHDPVMREKLKRIKVYIDSPMAIDATEVFRKNAQVFNEAYRSRLLAGDDPLGFDNLVYTRTTEESQAINANRAPKVIISASGMCEAGRIRHHLKHHLWRQQDAVVFVGYQAEGSLGREILNGAPSVRLFGEEIQVNAQVHNLEGFSAHADHAGLLSWVKGLQERPSALFLVHGDAGAKEALARAIVQETGYAPIAVSGISEFSLSKQQVTTLQQAMADIVDEEDLALMRGRIGGIRGTLEKLLAEAESEAATVAAEGHGSDGRGAARIAEINNRLLALEKDAIGLASSIAER